MLFLLNIMSEGEKIKDARKKIKATQKEIGGSDYTGSFIGAIERGEGQLTYASASKISSNIKEIGKKRNIDVEWVTVDYLLEDINMQVIENVNKIYLHLENINDIEEFNLSVEEAEHFISNYLAYIDDENKYNLYKLIYTKFYEFWEFYECKAYVIKCLALANRLHIDVTQLILMLTRTGYFIGEYKNMVTWGKTIALQESNDMESFKTIQYNIAKAYKCLNKINTCISVIEKIQKEFLWNQEEQLRLKLLLAECYKENKEYNKTKKLYSSILEEAFIIDSISYKILVYANLGELYMIKSNYIKAVEYISKALMLEDMEFKDKYLIQQEVFNTAFDIYLRVNNFSNGKKYFIKTINAAEITRDETLLIKAFNKMFEFCKDMNKDDYMIELLNLLETKIMSGIIKNDKILNIFFFATHYLKTRDVEKSDLIYKKHFNLIQIIK